MALNVGGVSIDFLVNLPSLSTGLGHAQTMINTFTTNVNRNMSTIFSGLANSPAFNQMNQQITNATNVMNQALNQQARQSRVTADTIIRDHGNMGASLIGLGLLMSRNLNPASLISFNTAAQGFKSSAQGFKDIGTLMSTIPFSSVFSNFSSVMQIFRHQSIQSFDDLKLGLMYTRDGFKSLNDISKRTLQESIRDAENLKNSLIQIGKYAGVALAGIFTKGLEEGIKYNAMIEQTRIGLETLFAKEDTKKGVKSGTTGDALLKQVKTIADMTPFEFPELADATRRMAAFGFEAKAIPSMLIAMGDAASGLGLGADGLNRITLALGQMKAKGRVMGGEMMQLTEAGIPAWDLLAKAMGKTTAEIMDMSQKGTLPAGKAIQDLLKGMEAQFKDMMLKQSKTLLGVWSTFKDNLKAALGDWTAPLLEPLKGAMNVATDYIGKFSAGFRAGGLVGGLFNIGMKKEDISNILIAIEYIKSGFSTLVNIGAWVGSVLKIVFNNITNGLKLLAPIISFFGRIFGSMFSPGESGFKKIVAGIVTAIVVFGSFNSIMNLVKTALVMVLMPLGKLIVSLFTMNIPLLIGITLGTLYGLAVAKLSNAFKDLTPEITMAGISLGILISFFFPLIGLFIIAVTMIGSMIPRFKKLSDAGVSTGEALWIAFKDVFVDIGNYFIDMLNGIGKGFTAFMNLFKKTDTKYVNIKRMITNTEDKLKDEATRPYTLDELTGRKTNKGGLGNLTDDLTNTLNSLVKIDVPIPELPAFDPNAINSITGGDPKATKDAEANRILNEKINLFKQLINEIKSATDAISGFGDMFTKQVFEKFSPQKLVNVTTKFFKQIAEFQANLAILQPKLDPQLYASIAGMGIKGLGITRGLLKSTDSQFQKITGNIAGARTAGENIAKVKVEIDHKGEISIKGVNTKEELVKSTAILAKDLYEKSNSLINNQQLANIVN